MNKLNQFADPSHYSLYVDESAKVALSHYREAGVFNFLVYQFTDQSIMIAPIYIPSTLKTMFKTSLKSFYIDNNVFYILQTVFSKFRGLDFILSYNSENCKFEFKER